jgi:hypothetical protein
MTNQSIIKIVRHEREFLMMSNSAIQDRRLSFHARGMLAYLLSLPNDWVIRMSHLNTVGPDGWRKVQRALRELRNCGYAKLIPIQGEKGRKKGRQWIIYETRQPADNTKNQLSAKGALQRTKRCTKVEEVPAIAGKTKARAHKTDSLKSQRPGQHGETQRVECDRRFRVARENSGPSRPSTPRQLKQFAHLIGCQDGETIDEFWDSNERKEWTPDGVLCHNWKRLFNGWWQARLRNGGHPAWDNRHGTNRARSEYLPVS